MSSEFATIARIRRPQGRRGEVIAELFTDFPERFETARSLSLLAPDGQRRPATLLEFWFHKGGVVLKFDGVDEISGAEKLAGYEVQIPSTERRKLEGLNVYVSDLPGCRVVERGKELGSVLYLDTTVGTPVLVVDTGSGELLIPFAEEICRRIDVAARVIEVELPEGLTELNR